MPDKPQPKPKLTDEERYKRFLDTAREVEASDDPKDFDRAFERVTSRAPGKTGSRDAS